MFCHLCYDCTFQRAIADTVCVWMMKLKSTPVVPLTIIAAKRLTRKTCKTGALIKSPY